jgi:hypothetical protein
MSNKTAKPNNTAKKVEESVKYDEKFLKVFDTFWQELPNVVNHDVYLLKFLKVEYPNDYEIVRKILNTKDTNWQKDLAIRKHFKAQNMLPKVIKATKKATNGKSKAK